MTLCTVHDGYKQRCYTFFFDFLKNVSWVLPLSFSSYVDMYDLPDPCDNIDIILRYITCKMNYKTKGTVCTVDLQVERFD